MALPISFVAITQVDYSNEKSSVGFAIPTLDPANLTAMELKIFNFYAALLNISLGNNTLQNTTLQKNLINAIPPTNPLAQRENKWLVRYRGNTLNKLFTAEVPCADLSMLSTSPQSDFADLGNTAIATFKTQFDGLVVSPDDGAEACTLQSLQFVGRRI